MVDLKEALFYRKKEKKVVECFLCNHKCVIKDGDVGICGVRKNIGGILYSLNYGKVVAKSIDPIEKKPLFHFFPGSSAYSIACVGCNFQCTFCQNWEISQKKEADKLGISATYIPAEKIVEDAINSNCKSISYTYTEPTVYFEFAYDCAKLAKQEGLYNNFVTNGFMSKEALKEILPYLDAANVDLKSFSDQFYKKLCKARLNPVLENIKLMKEYGIWVEVTTLIIPQMNDSEEELFQIASFIASLGKDIPWHVSRFHPDYKLSLPSTSLDILEKAYKIGKNCGLRYVYIGNTYTDYGENTYCYNCSNLLIKRYGFWIEEYMIEAGRCKFCGAKIDGVGL